MSSLCLCQTEVMFVMKVARNLRAELQKERIFGCCIHTAVQTIPISANQWRWVQLLHGNGSDTRFPLSTWPQHNLLHIYTGSQTNQKELRVCAVQNNVYWQCMMHPMHLLSRQRLLLYLIKLRQFGNWTPLCCKLVADMAFGTFSDLFDAKYWVLLPCKGVSSSEPRLAPLQALPVDWFSIGEEMWGICMSWYDIT